LKARKQNQFTVQVSKLDNKSLLYSLSVNSDGPSYRRIFDLFFPPLKRFAYTFLKNTEQAEEIASDVLIVLWENRHKLAAIENIRVYLFVVARNKCLNVLKSRHSNPVVSLNDVTIDIAFTGKNPEQLCINSEVRKKIAESILNFEARRDANGHLRVYNLPPSDGGGRYEVAGINERYDSEEAAKLRDLVNAGRYDEAERDAAEYIAQYTDIVSKWTTVPSIEAYLRDCTFNRGPGGAAKILQMALGVKVDGGVGPETLAALRKAEKDPARLLAVLRVAREHYELRVAGRRPEFWKGLVNRWDKSLAFAQGIA